MLALFSPQVNVAIGLVLSVFVLALLSRFLGSSGDVAYSPWFVERVNLLVDTAVQKTDEGLQNNNGIYAVQNFTVAISILETLQAFLNEQELERLTGMDIRKFTLSVEQLRVSTIGRTVKPVVAAGSAP